MLKYRPWFKKSHGGFKAWPFTIVLWDCHFHLNQSWLQWIKLSNNLGWLIRQYFLWAYVTQRLVSVCSIYKALKSIVKALLRLFQLCGLQASCSSFTGVMNFHILHTWSLHHELSLYLRHVAEYAWHATLELDCYAWPWSKFSMVHRFLRFTCAISSISLMTVFLLQFKNFSSSNMRTGKFLKWYNFPAWTWSMRSSHMLVC